MSKLDNIFAKILSDPILAEKYRIDPSRYPTVGKGYMAMDAHVKYIARILTDIDAEVAKVKARMRENHESDAVELSETQMKSIYNVSLPIINTGNDEN